MPEPKVKRVHVEYVGQDSDDEPRQFECDRLSVGKYFLQMERVTALPGGWMFDRVGIPLSSIRTWYEGEGVSHLNQEPPLKRLEFD
jgi:hypothetical protein